MTTAPLPVPADLTTEALVLGALFDPGVALTAWAHPLLREALFSSELHVRLFRAFRGLAMDGITPSVPAVVEHADYHLATEDVLDALRVKAELQPIDLAYAIPHLALLVTCRAAHYEGLRLVQAAQSPATIAQEVLQASERMHATLVTSPDAEIGGLVSPPGELEEIFARTPGYSDGATTGLPALDSKLHGFMPTGLHIIAGRPGMGKSAFAQQVAEHIAATDDPVLFISQEMRARELRLRRYTRLSGIPLLRIEANDLTAEDRALLGTIRDTARLELEGRLFVLDTPLDSIEVSLWAKRLRMRCPQQRLGAVFVDHLGLLADERERGESDANRIERITRRMKLLAMQLATPVFLVCQLNRDAAKRKLKRPTLTDLRGSGSIEQDADTILFLHRDSYYEDNPPESDEAEVGIGKQRRGPTGLVPVYWSGPAMRFAPLSEAAAPDEASGDVL